MKAIAPLIQRRGRLEIIPLIDIMFFLLAAFMLVSIDKIHVKSLKVSLPTNVPTAQPEKKEDFVSISIDADGKIQVERDLVASKDALLQKLQSLYAVNKDQKFLISADGETRHRDIMGVLGALRSAGFQKIGFSVSPIPEASSSTPGAVTPSASPAIEQTPPAVAAVNLPSVVPAPSIPANPSLTPPPDANHP